MTKFKSDASFKWCNYQVNSAFTPTIVFKKKSCWNIRKLVLLVTLLLSGMVYGKDLNQKVIISGKIDDKQLMSKPVLINQINLFNKEYATLKVFPNKEGIFQKVINCNNKQEINIKCGKWIKAIVNPGDSIHINIYKKSSENPDVIFSGDNHSLNNQLYNYITNYQSKVISTPKLNKAYKDKTTSTINRFAERTLKHLSKQQKIFMETVTPEMDMKQWMSTELKFYKYNILLSYAYKHRKLNNISRYKWSIPKGYYKFFNKMPDISEQDFICTELMNYVCSGVSIMVTENFTKEFIKGIPRNLGKPDHLFFNRLCRTTAKHPMIKNITLGKFVHSRLDRYATSVYAELKPQLTRNISSNIILEGLEKRYNKLIDFGEKRLENSSIRLLKIDSNRYDNIIKEIAKKNPTKIVFIDFWATWCSPCIAAMKKAPVYHNKFRNKDISFVYICTNSKEHEWKIAISKNKLIGNHYFLNKNQTMAVNESLNLKSLPRYLILVNGKVYKTDQNLSSPSSTDTNKILNNLL